MSRFTSIPKTGISDPQLRPVIDAIRQSVEVGTAGPKDSRWVTWADLKEAGIVVQSGAGWALSGGSGSGAGGANQPPNMLIGGWTVQKLLQELQGQVKEEHLYRSLNERIDKIDGNAFVGGSVEQRIDEAGNSIARKIDTVSTATTNNRATVQVVSESVNGLEAQYTVKIDQNGFVSGFGLASELRDGTPYSNFIVNADRFAIANPSATLLTITSLTRVGNVATLVWTGTAPTLTTKDYITVRNAADAKWNGTWKVVSVNNTTKTLTFAVTTNPTTPAVAIGTQTLKMGVSAIPFIVESGNVIIENALIKNLTSDNIATGSITVGSLAEKPIVYVGSFASAPSTASYEINSVYKNTTDGNSYILTLVSSVKTWTLYLAKGTDGSSSKSVSISATSQVFQIAKSGTISPSTITVSAAGQNLTGSPTFSVTSGTAVLTGASTTSKTLAYSDLTTDAATIRVTWDGLTDSITIVKVREGSDAVTAYLTNESHTLTADASGSVSSYDGATTQMVVLVGSTDDTANWSFARTNSVGVSSSIASNLVTVTGLTVDSSFIDITASKTGYPSITKRFSVSKSKTGASGATGPRGTTNISYAITGTVWTDAAAVTALSATGYGAPVSRDIVTLFNSSAGYSETKFYDGSTSSWLALTAYVNGNLLVDGTISAQKLTISGGNQRIDNASFTIGGAGWGAWTTTAPITFTSITSTAIAGVTAVKSTTAGDGPNNGLTYLSLASGAQASVPVSNSNMFGVTPGDSFHLRAYARAVSSPNADLIVRLRFLQSDRTTTVSSVTITFNRTTDTSFTKREFASTEGTVPANASFAVVEVIPAANITTGSWRVGDLFCTSRSSGTLIVDGSITAGKIDTTDLVARRFRSVDATGYRIEVNPSGSVTAGTLVTYDVNDVQTATLGRPSSSPTLQVVRCSTSPGNSTKTGYGLDVDYSIHARIYAGSGGGHGYPVPLDILHTGDVAAYFESTTTHGIKVKGSGVESFDIVCEGTGKILAGDTVLPFTGAHEALIAPDDAVEVGDIVVDSEMLAKEGVSNTLCRVTPSTAVTQKAAIGVVSSEPTTWNVDTSPFLLRVEKPAPQPVEGEPWPNSDHTTGYVWRRPEYAALTSMNYVLVNALGEGQINVCGENGAIEAGDLIVTSSIPGKGMRQSDDVVRSITVAKARESVTFSSPTEVKMIGCIYLCG